MPDDTDRGLIRAMLAGEEEAFRRVVALHEKPLYNFILRYAGDRTLAEDLMQETFLRMLRALGTWRPKASFKTWLFTIARNLCLDHLKYRRRHPAESLDAPVSGTEGKIINFAEVLRSGVAAPETRAMDEEVKGRVREAVARLDPLKREALLLRVFHEMSYEEAARVVGAPVGTVKFRVHEAVRELGRLMNHEKDENKRRDIVE